MEKKGNRKNFTNNCISPNITFLFLFKSYSSHFLLFLLPTLNNAYLVNVTSDNGLQTLSIAEDNDTFQELSVSVKINLPSQKNICGLEGILEILFYHTYPNNSSSLTQPKTIATFSFTNCSAQELILKQPPSPL